MTSEPSAERAEFATIWRDSPWTINPNTASQIPKEIAKYFWQAAEAERTHHEAAWQTWWKQLFEAWQIGHYNPNAMGKLLHAGPKPHTEVEGW